MLRILHILDSLRRGGLERQFIELIKGLDKSKFEIHTIVLEKRNNGYDDIAKELSHNFEYKLRRFRWDIILILDFVKYCKKHKIQAIQVWDGMSAFYGFLVSLICGIKFINYSIQDADPRVTYRHLIKRLILKLSKYVIANQYAGLKVYGVEKKGKVIYNGIDLERFRGGGERKGQRTEARSQKSEDKSQKAEDRGQKTEVRNQKIEDSGKFVIGIVANLTEYKDYYTFFDAIKILQDKITNLEVHIIGGGKLTQTYKDYAIKIGVNQNIIKYFGTVKNPEDYIPNFDVGVLCSYKNKGEGLSNSVLEYMACGVPPVITDIGAAREIIDDGITGLLFEARNANDLANKILLLVEDKQLRTKIGERAMQVVFEKFGYERYIKEMEEYYEEICHVKINSIRK